MSCVKAPSCFVWKAQCTFKIKGIAVWDASTQLHITHPYMILHMLFLCPNFKPRDHNRFYIRLQKTNITKMMFKRNSLHKFDVITFQVMFEGMGFKRFHAPPNTTILPPAPRHPHDTIFFYHLTRASAGRPVLPDGFPGRATCGRGIS